MEEERPKKNFLYEKSINNVIAHARCESSKDDSKTTIYIPVEHEIALKELEDKYGKSGTCTIKYAVQLGFSIFEHENKDSMKQISELRKRLLYSNNPKIPDILLLLKTNIGKNNSTVKRNIIQSRNTIAAIKKNSDSLNASLSSFIQMLLNYTLSTIDTNTLKIREIRNNAREEKIQFQTTINNTLDVLIRLISGEKTDEVELVDETDQE